MFKQQNFIFIREVVFMSKGVKTLVIILVIVVAIFGVVKFFAGTYNTMVGMEEGVLSQWAQVENQYQRRLDLVPNLVATVKGYASHESEVFTEVAEARSQAGGVMELSSDVLDDPEALARFQQAQNSLGGALQRLLSVTENYPQLQANQNFMALQDELEGTENRIATERMRFNETVQEYNKYIRTFPNNIIANMNGFEKKAYFTATDEAKTAPKVEF
jgi:LemA protein